MAILGEVAWNLQICNSFFFFFLFIRWANRGPWASCLHILMLELIKMYSSCRSAVDMGKLFPWMITYKVTETTILSTSLGKTFFAWRFILNKNILFWLTISYQKPFVFSVSMFCFQIFTLKLNLRSKVGLTYAFSIVKWFFFNFCLRQYFLLFFAEFELLMFHNNIVKISENLNKGNLLKIWLQVTYPTDFCMILLHFYYGKKWKYLIF